MSNEKKKTIWDDPNLFPDFGDVIPKMINDESDVNNDDDKDVNGNADIKGELDPNNDFDFSNPNDDDKGGFSEGDEVDDDDGNINDNVDDDVDDDSDDDYRSYVEALKEAGVLNVEDIPESISQEKLIELQQEEIEKRLDAEFDRYMESIGPEGVEFLKYTKDGGDPKKFFETYSKTFERPKLDDSSSEEDYEAMVKYFLKNKRNLTYSEIEDQVEFFKSKEKLAEKAVNFESILSEEENAEKLRLQEEAKKELENRKKMVNDFNQQLKSSFDSDFISSKIPSIDKNKISSMILDPIKSGEFAGSTKLNVKIAELFRSENKEKLILLAHILDNDFDFKDIEKSIKSKVVDNEQKEIRKIKISKMGRNSRSKRATRFTDRL